MDIEYYKKYEPIFGSWHIVRELGEGSYGKVFEIERCDLGHTYRAALKAISIPKSRSELEQVISDGVDRDSVSEYFHGFVRSLSDELVLMSSLKGDSHIVSYEDHCIIRHPDGVGWDILIRMELLTPLFTYLKDHRVSSATVARLGTDISMALESCKKLNIIHRDIKPENMFYSELGSFKLGDFGIARRIDKTTGGLSKKGTYNYMAPEVYRGEKYGPSVDIYSLGLVMYKLLNNNRMPFVPTDTRSFTSEDAENARVLRLEGKPLPPPVYAEGALAEIILKACAYDPHERYRDPTELRLALEAFSAGCTDSAEFELHNAFPPDATQKTKGVRSSCGSIKKTGGGFFAPDELD